MLGTYLSILRRRWAMVVLATIILAPMLFVGLTTSSGLYQSTAIVQVLNNSVAEGVLGTTRGYQDPDRLLASELEVLNSPAVAQGAAALLREEGWRIDAEEVRSSIEVSPRGLSSYIEVIGSDPRPARAQELTSAFVDSYRNYKLELQREELERLDEELRARLVATEAELVELDAAAGEDSAAARQRAALLGRYESLSSLIEEIRLRLSVDTSGVEVLTQASEPEAAEGALPPVPAAVAALIAAAALASAMALLLDLLRDPVRTREEIDHIVPEASVVTLPRPPGDRQDCVRAVSDARSAAARAARTAQQRWGPLVGGAGGSVVVTSTAHDAEQRVYVATALAAAAARADRRVLIVGELLDPSLLVSPSSSHRSKEALDDDGAGVVATTIPGLWWTARRPSDGRHDVDRGQAQLETEAFDVIVRVREDAELDPDLAFGPVPFVVAVATLARTRARHLTRHARELDAAGLPVSGVVLVQLLGRRGRKPRRVSRPLQAGPTFERADAPASDSSLGATGATAPRSSASTPSGRSRRGRGEHDDADLPASVGRDVP